MKKEFYTLQSIVNDAKRLKISKIFIFSHEKPDGDAKGASMALVTYFENLGFISQYIMSYEYDYLNQIFAQGKVANDIGTDPFIAIIVDTANEEKCENLMYQKAVIKYKIDHHKDSELYGDLNYIDEEASSTCEIVYRLMDRKFITPQIATYLYTGIYTDTGTFAFGMRAQVFQVCADLAELNADIVSVQKYVNQIGVWKAKAAGYVALYHKKFENGFCGLKVFEKYRQQYKFNAEVLAKAVNTLKDIKDIQVFFVACEDAEKNKIFVEIRSSEDCKIDVGKIAEYYGGNGHKHAANFVASDWRTVDIMIEFVKNLIITDRIQE